MSFAHRVIRTKPLKKDLPSENHDPHVVAAEMVQISAPMSEREISWPRGSKLYDMCVRQNVIGTVEKSVVKEWSSVAGRVTFSIGNAIHYWFQNTGDIFGDKRRGWWRCLACRKVVGFGGPPAKKCRHCGAHPEAIIYHEHGIKLSGDPVFFTGHVDMFLARLDAIRVAEIKTIDGDKWEKLVAPLAMHEWQLQSYMWSLSLDKRFPIKFDPSVGYLAYVSKKQTTGKLPVKIYPVQRSEATINHIVHRLDAYKIGLRSYPDKLAPPHEDCARTNFSNYRAKSCPVRAKCVELLEAA